MGMRIRLAMLWMVLSALHMGPVPGADAVSESQAAAGEDPYLWLEDVHGQKPLEWVQAQNARSRAVLQADPDYQKDYAAILRVMDASDRIPYGDLDHGYVFNFWQDAGHPKGIWRRTRLADYRRAAPDWELLLDLDRLAADAALPAEPVARRRRRGSGARIRSARAQFSHRRLPPYGGQIDHHLSQRR